LNPERAENNEKEFWTLYMNIWLERPAPWPFLAAVLTPPCLS